MYKVDIYKFKTKTKTRFHSSTKLNYFQLLDSSMSHYKRIKGVVIAHQRETSKKGLEYSSVYLEHERNDVTKLLSFENHTIQVCTCY